jgi:hypothetical protein
MLKYMYNADRKQKDRCAGRLDKAPSVNSQHMGKSSESHVLVKLKV